MYIEIKTYKYLCSSPDSNSHLDKLHGVSSRQHVQEKEIGHYYSYSKHCYLVLVAVEAVSAGTGELSIILYCCF